MAAPAHAVCGPRDKVVAQLAKKHKESQRHIGLNNGGTHLIEIWVTKDDSAYTVLTVDRRGVACIRAAGKNWQTVKPGVSH